MLPRPYMYIAYTARYCSDNNNQLGNVLLKRNVYLPDLNVRPVAGGKRPTHTSLHVFPASVWLMRRARIRAQWQAMHFELRVLIVAVVGRALRC